MRKTVFCEGFDVGSVDFQFTWSFVAKISYFYTCIEITFQMRIGPSLTWVRQGRYQSNHWSRRRGSNVAAIVLRWLLYLFGSKQYVQKGDCIC